jgi:hypothetical protein
MRGHTGNTRIMGSSWLCCPSSLRCCPLTLPAEWLEDHVKTTFRLIRRGTIICASLQLLWLVLDRRVLWPNLIGLASHANSWYMLKWYYPSHMGLDQPATIAALVLLVVHQTAWVLTWAHEASGLLDVAAILATVVWPIPIMLLLSAGTDSELPIRMPFNGEGAKGSIPSSPRAASQPGSPYVDTTRLRMRQTMHQRSSTDPRVPAVDTLHQQDQAAAQQGAPLLSSMHSRKGSGGSGSLEGSSSLSSSFSAAWGLAERLQQQQGFKKHRSRFVQAMHRLQELAGMQPAASVLPVAVAGDPHKR